MQTPLSWWKRLIIKHFLLEWCRDAVGYRELSKSIMVKLQSYFRDSILVLGSDMAAQGILPERDLIFFLKLDEIQRLCANERNPTLIMKAKQRKRLYPKMNAMKFDEFVKGFRMAPRVSSLILKVICGMTLLLLAGKERNHFNRSIIGSFERCASDNWRY